MTDSTPQEPTDLIQVSEQTLPHSGNLGLEQPVEQFDNTSLGAAVEEDTEGNRLLSPLPDTTEHLPPELLPDAPAQTESRKNPWRKPLAILAGAATLIAAGVGIGVAASGGSSDNGPKVEATKPSTPPSTVPETTSPAPTTAPEARTQSEVPADVQLQVSDDPDQLGTYTFNNRATWINSGDDRVVDYIYTDTANGQNIRSNMESLITDGRQKIASNPGSYMVFIATPQGKPVFSPNDTSRTVTYQIVQHLESSSGISIGTSPPFTETLTYLPVEKYIDQGAGKQLVKEWLVDTQYSSVS